MNVTPITVGEAPPSTKTNYAEVMAVFTALFMAIWQGCYHQVYLTLARKTESVFPGKACIVQVDLFLRCIVIVPADGSIPPGIRGKRGRGRGRGSRGRGSLRGGHTANRLSS